jgi:hypothetical protein
VTTVHIPEDPTAAAQPPGPGPRGTAAPLIARALAAVAGLAAVGAMCWSGLNHDVRYELGGMRAAGRGGIPSSGTFVHRPLAYRRLLSGDCRYPTPDFLQRTRYDRSVTGLASYRENLRCLDDPTARYAVLDTSWFPLDKVAPQVSAAVRERFDCARPIASYPAPHLEICARRR